MKYFIHTLLILLASLSVNQLKACEVCGCGVNASYFGTLPSGNTHFLGVRYGYSNFNAAVNYDSELIEDEFSRDQFHRMDIMSRFSFGDHILLAANVPYLVNSANGSHQNHRINGLGDASLIVYFKPDLNKDLSPVSHTLFIGAGIELPTGKSQEMATDELLNRNFQLGSGSYDWILSGNYTMQKMKFGVNLDASFKLNTKAKDHYQFGNQLATSTNVLYYLNTGSVTFIPFTGVYFEHSEAHKSFDIEQPNTGGHSLLGTLGMQVSLKKMVINTQYQVPFVQNFDTDEISTISGGSRLSIGMYYSFSSSKNSFSY